MEIRVCSECQYENPATAEFCRQCRFPFDGEWPSLVDKIVGNYKLVRRVGGGGFGAVYEARHITLGNAFAVKILDPRLAKEEHFVERFQQEAHVMAELRHENVLQVLDFGFSEDVGSYLVTEWLEGKSLFKIWRYTGNKLDWGWVLAIYSQLLDALELAHERGIVHRDLKPENIMLTTGSRDRILIKIVDFGIAQMVGHHYEEKQSEGDKKGEESEDTEMIVGTPYYMAPEQILGEMDLIGPRSDLYACGIMLGELLTGQRIFEGSSHEEIMRLHLDVYPPSLQKLSNNKDFPESIENVFQQALAKEPDQRFQSAEEFYNALQEAMKKAEIEPIWEYIYQDLDTTKRPPSLSERGQIQYKKVDEDEDSSSKTVMFGVVSFLLFLAVLGFLWFSLTTPIPKKQIHRKKSNKPRIRAKWLDSSDSHSDAGVKNQKKQILLKNEHSKEPIIPDSLAKDQKMLAKKDNKKRHPSLKKRPRISLKLLSVPSGTRVWINGRYRGKTPLRFKAFLNKRLRLLLKKKGYVKHKFTWKIRKYKRKRKIILIEKLL